MEDLLPLTQGAWFGQLSEPFRAHLLTKGRRRRLGAGEVLFARGDAPDGLYGLVDGRMEIGAVDAEGRAAVLAVVEPGTWFGEIAVFDGRPRTHDATALERSQLLHLPQAALLEFLRDTPACWRELALLLTEKLRLTFMVAEDWALLPAPRRLAARLLMIAEGYGGAGRRQTEIRLSQEQLAAMLALSRQTANQLLKRLEARGIVALRPGRLTILDLEGLRQAAETED